MRYMVSVMLKGGMVHQVFRPDMRNVRLFLAQFEEEVSSIVIQLQLDEISEMEVPDDD